MVEQTPVFGQNGMSIQIEKWQKAFCDYLDRDSVVNKWVRMGTDRGVVDDSDEGKMRLAREIGAVFAFAFDESTGGEKVVEDLNPQEISQATGIQVERLEVLGRLMVDAGIINSRKLLEARRRRNNNF